MNKILAVFLKEYLERVRRRSFIVGLILVPLFMGAVIILPIWLSSLESEGSERVLVLDATDRYKAIFEEAIQRTLPDGRPRFEFADAEAPGLAATSAEGLAALLETEALDWYLILPADLETGGKPEFHGRVVSNFTLLEMLEEKLAGLLRRERLKSMNLDPALLEQLSEQPRLKTIQHKGGQKSEAGFESLYLSTMVMVMILYMTILVFGTMIMRSILEDKNQRVTEVVLSCMSATRFFAGKILGIGAVGLTQYLAWALMAAVAAGFGLLSALKSPAMQQLPALQPATYGYFMLFYVLGFLLYAGLFAAVGAMSTTDQEAQQLMQPLVMLLVVPLLLIVFFFQNPDATVSVALSLIPFFAPLLMFMRLNISAPPVWQIVLSIALLAASVAVVIVMSGRIFRVGILMTGKRASLAEAWRWLRES